MVYIEYNLLFMLYVEEKLHNYYMHFDLGEKEQSLEEISLRLINSIMLEKSDLEQQYAEVSKE